MNNYQWLLQMDGAERKAWFDAEHVERQERALDGGTEPENEDSRDKLEADIRQYANPEGNTGTLGACWERKMLEFIDRQAAITEREYGERMASEAMCSRICVVVSEQREQIAELTAERDNLADELLIVNNERERYREKFGKCLDYADAIHALMDDEGMA